MIALLRLIGLFNAALWIGASLFFCIVVGPTMTGGSLHTVFGGTRNAYSDYYASFVGLVLVQEYYKLHYVCGGISLLHSFIEAAYQGNSLKNIRNLASILILSLSLVAGLAIHPLMTNFLIAQVNPRLTVPQRLQAAHSFGVWRVIVYAINITMTAGTCVVFWNIIQPSQRQTRFSSPMHFSNS